jgi:hypothetical protein
MRLDIVPLTIAQFNAFFEAMFMSQNVSVAAIRDLLDTCGTFRQALHAPEWKVEIEQTVRAKATTIMEKQI